MSVSEAITNEVGEVLGALGVLLIGVGQYDVTRTLPDDLSETREAFRANLLSEADVLARRAMALRRAIHHASGDTE